MLRAFVLILSLAIASSALAHSDTKWTKGPYGGHMVDAGNQQLTISPVAKTTSAPALQKCRWGARATQADACDRCGGRPTGWQRRRAAEA
jgi:hypothetical protein